MLQPEPGAVEKKGCPTPTSNGYLNRQGFEIKPENSWASVDIRVTVFGLIYLVSLITAVFPILCTRAEGTEADGTSPLWSKLNSWLLLQLQAGCRAI
jgi:hypothetical protein